MDELKPIITYQTQEYGFIRVRLRQALDSRASPVTVCGL